MSAEEPKPYQYTAMPQPLSEKLSSDAHSSNSKGGDEEAPPITLVNAPQRQGSQAVASTGLEKIEPKLFVEPGRPSFRDSLQQWGEMSFDEKFKPTAGTHKYNDVGSFSKSY